MSEKDRVIEEKVSHSGIFDFKSFYKYAHSWFNEEGFGVVEQKYTEKVSGNSRDISIEWAVTKKISDYFKIEIKVSRLRTWSSSARFANEPNLNVIA